MRVNQNKNEYAFCSRRMERKPIAKSDTEQGREAMRVSTGGEVTDCQNSPPSAFEQSNSSNYASPGRAAASSSLSTPNSHSHPSGQKRQYSASAVHDRAEGRMRRFKDASEDVNSANSSESDDVDMDSHHTGLFRYGRASLALSLSEQVAADPRLSIHDSMDLDEVERGMEDDELHSMEGIPLSPSPRQSPPSNSPAMMEEHRTRMEELCAQTERILREKEANGERDLTVRKEELRDLQERMNSLDCALEMMKDAAAARHEPFNRLVQQLGEQVAELRETHDSLKEFLEFASTTSASVVLDLGLFGVLPNEVRSLEGVDTRTTNTATHIQDGLWRQIAEREWPECVTRYQFTKRPWKWVYECRSHTFPPYPGKEGRGSFLLPNGNHYEGEWKDDQRHGWGVSVMNNGRVYEGEWRDDKRNGWGAFRWPGGHKNAGDVYIGDWRDSKRHGWGKYIWADGRVYEGLWENDKRAGGKSIYPDGHQYEGDYRKGKRHGFGKTLYPQGEVYQGGYKNNKRDGLGTFWWANGDSFYGNWSKGRRKGKGILSKVEEKKYYEQSWNETDSFQISDQGMSKTSPVTAKQELSGDTALRECVRDVELSGGALSRQVSSSGIAFHHEPQRVLEYLRELRAGAATANDSVPSPSRSMHGRSVTPKPNPNPTGSPFRCMTAASHDHSNHSVEGGSDGDGDGDGGNGNDGAFRGMQYLRHMHPSHNPQTLNMNYSFTPSSQQENANASSGAALMPAYTTTPSTHSSGGHGANLPFHSSQSQSHSHVNQALSQGNRNLERFLREQEEGFRCDEQRNDT